MIIDHLRLIVQSRHRRNANINLDIKLGNLLTGRYSDIEVRHVLTKNTLMLSSYGSFGIFPTEYKYKGYTEKLKTVKKKKFPADMVFMTHKYFHMNFRVLISNLFIGICNSFINILNRYKTI